ncbi:MAG TPA: nickel pincer cofactor biosynthesis protein LarC [candidate division WOR-3 bacterium]|uniref:Nickel pincer cofactor biosynthesis protein LarC n=1 Tax=candidate division WOR-3 bacterium TaxID=2052148 RepID=A0A9C9JZL7_UNCW3|nr:nickel pincer cofactor biosynthesis protein LarC [candidate division WOR-3 bacterium]
MKILYFDPISGASGDMILAALIDCGVPIRYLKEKLKFIPRCELKVVRLQKQGVSARGVRFKINTKIKEDRFIPLINKSDLTPKIKKDAIKIINRIFSVEKKVHRSPSLHLHELADADTLLDITGALVALDYLQVEKIYSRALKAGIGFIKTQEGNMPSFNFATAELLKGFPVEFLPIPAELTTPTGAAIISTIAEPTNRLVFSKIHAVGLGAGTYNLKDYPNLMRIFIGESIGLIEDECTVIETNIDDMNPQDYELVFDRLYDAGALEVFMTPVIMKRSRPGILLTVLAQDNIDGIMQILLTETTTLGVRFTKTSRRKITRSIKKVKSPYGTIRIKIAEFNQKMKFSIEYEDLKKLALRSGCSIQKLRSDLISFVTRELNKGHYENF